ncbi:MAG: GHMP kinase [Flavobacterium sp. BFFFF2]|nr:MAG: GHMP kinase [Flavobacterium sp. BFFFF2]
MNQSTFYSNGKLLLTGEYLVLDGAQALAIPTRFGQSLQVTPNNSNDALLWRSLAEDGSCWFETALTMDQIRKGQPADESDSVVATLINLLHQAYQLRPACLDELAGSVVETQLSFPREWGLGTSSTLVNNLGQWLQVNPYQLLKGTFGGSGYDIACAQTNSALLYQLQNDDRTITPVHFDPIGKAQLYFVYLNRKQNSKSSIASYWSRRPLAHEWIPKIDHITQNVLQNNDAQSMAEAFRQHEIWMSSLLELPTAQELHFPDFEGIIKSLGAWGGDFVLAISHENPTAYFAKKGFSTVIPYAEMAL